MDRVVPASADKPTAVRASRGGEAASCWKFCLRRQSEPGLVTDVAVRQLNVIPDFTPSTLDTVGRHHTVKETVEKFYTFPGNGMNNKTANAARWLSGQRFVR